MRVDLYAWFGSVFPAPGVVFLQSGSSINKWPSEWMNEWMQIPDLKPVNWKTEVLAAQVGNEVKGSKMLELCQLRGAQSAPSLEEPPQWDRSPRGKKGVPWVEWPPHFRNTEEGDRQSASDTERVNVHLTRCRNPASYDSHKCSLWPSAQWDGT